MAKQTLTQMLTRLSENLEDENNALFSVDKKVQLLNDAQTELVALIPVKSMPELYVETDDQVITSSSKFDLSGLSETVSTQSLGLLRFPDGIETVKFTDGADMFLITHTQLQKVRQMFGPTSNDDGQFFDVWFPQYMYEGSDIRILPTIDDASETLDFRWVREPVQMVSSPNVDCELQEYNQLAIIDLATAFGFKTEDERARKEEYLGSFSARVELIRNRFPKTQSNVFKFSTFRSRFRFQPGSGGAFFA